MSTTQDGQEPVNQEVHLLSTNHKAIEIMASYIFFLILLSYLTVSEGNFSIPQSRAGRLKTKEKEDSEGYGLKTEEDVRDSRIFSIFSIVQFKNTGCTSTMALS